MQVKRLFAYIDVFIYMSHHAPDFSTHARPHASMYAQWQQQQKHQQQLHPLIKMQWWPNSGPL